MVVGQVGGVVAPIWNGRVEIVVELVTSLVDPSVEGRGVTAAPTVSVVAVYEEVNPPPPPSTPAITDAVPCKLADCGGGNPLSSPSSTIMLGQLVRSAKQLSPSPQIVWVSSPLGHGMRHLELALIQSIPQ